MYPEVEQISKLLPKLENLADKLNDMVAGFSNSSSSATIDLSLILAYMDDYTQYKLAMNAIRKRPPQSYFSDGDSQHIVMESIMKQSYFGQHADRCLSLFNSVLHYYQDVHNS